MRTRQRLADFLDAYTQDLRAEDLQRLFTRDAREAYRYFSRGIDAAELAGLSWHRRVARQIRLMFLAFAMKLSPARRIVYAASLLFAVAGIANLFRGFDLAAVPLAFPLLDVRVPAPAFRQGTWSLIIAFGLMNLLVLLEVFDRLTLKNDLEIARDIQQAMLPSGVVSSAGVDIVGLTRPANTVGGDFYDILRLADGRLAVAVGDVAGKGSPAALLMALLVAMLRTLVDEGLEPSELVTRLNVQVSRHAPANRFITLFYGVYDPRTGELVYVNAGHLPPLLTGRAGTRRLSDGGIALGMFDGAVYRTGRTVVDQEDLLAIYSDGITEAENGSGDPFDEQGLEAILASDRAAGDISTIASDVMAGVRRHISDNRPSDDLTILLLRRRAAVAAVGV
jgi:serine phosphatase RsbU (regulator of sigma subunit)